MKFRRSQVHFLLVLLLPVRLLASPTNAENVEFFERSVRPLLERSCIECHGAEKSKGGLRLDSLAGWKEGGHSGAVIVEGDPDESLLVTAIRYRDKDLQMPPDDELSSRDKAVFEEWVRRGAPDPRTGEPAKSYAMSVDSWDQEFKKRLDWWSLQPLAKVSPPTPVDPKWAHDPVDRFIFAGLADKGLKPSRAADPETLMRRASLVLTGLPPTPEMRLKFLTDWAEDPAGAYPKLVDALLASPHFGEHFARHWMDVVRYTDTYGYEWDTDVKGAWEYRDYLIRAFNKDVGFDTLVVEQLAGDLLEKPRVDSDSGFIESLIGPLFYHMGLHQAGDSLTLNIVHQEMTDNKINALSKAFVATTVACARCHDHKLEAISQKDYYSLAAVLMTPRWTTRVIEAPDLRTRSIEKLSSLRGEIRGEIARLWAGTVEGPAFASADALRSIASPRGSSGPPIEDIADVISRIRGFEEWRLLLGPGQGAASAKGYWSSLRTRWQDERTQRITFNQSFRKLGDVARGILPEGWVIEGDGMRYGFVSDGTIRVALSGRKVVADLLHGGFYTHALSSKLPGSLRLPPQHQVPGRILSVKVAGEEFSGFRKVAANAFLADPLQFFDNASETWIAISDVTLTPQVEKVALEFETAALNPYFPPRTGISFGLPNPDAGHDRRSWFSMTGIVAHEKDGEPSDELEHFGALFALEPESIEDMWRGVAAWLRGAVVRWTAGRHSVGDTRLVNWLLTQEMIPNEAPAGSRLEALLAEYRTEESRLPSARTAMSMDERGTQRMTYRLNVRGNADMPGEPIEPAFLSMFANAEPVKLSQGSGRLELARSLIDPEHPMTSRVYVNRLWYWVFGKGIVDTTSDFGRLGGKPSHPGLLDWLAQTFVEEGWSTKRLLRRLLLSQTFRQSGEIDSAAMERDPGNRMLHHYPTRRLEAESLRDSLLLVSGSLDPSLYGRPIEVPRARVDSQKRLYSGTLDGGGRRSVYLKISMADPPKFLVAFNQPDPGMTAGTRDVTNVPAQALALMNDPFVHAAARRWAEHLVTDPVKDVDERIRGMFVSAYGRLPNQRELQRWNSALHGFAGASVTDVSDDKDAWSALAHALFNTKEFIFYR